jgi:hypothetical protein
LQKRSTQAQINKELFWLLTSEGWAYDTLPTVIDDLPPPELAIELITRKDIKATNNRDLCITSTIIEARWHSDSSGLTLTTYQVYPNRLL